MAAGGHPGPLTEVNFWQEKCDNLVSLYEQMEGEVTQKMASILHSTDSAYFPSFKKMFDKVVSALIEAMDITLYLKPLSEHFEVLTENQSVVILTPCTHGLLDSCLKSSLRVYCNVVGTWG